MSDNKTGNIILKIILKPFFGRKEKESFEIDKWENVLIIRQHNQFGDMLASVPLFRAIKEKYPDSKITLVAGPENYFAVEKNKFIDRLVLVEKKKLFHPIYFLNLIKILHENYDAIIVPATVSLSSTSHLIAAPAKSNVKIAPASLNEKENPFAFLFDYRINLNWNGNPKRHVSDFIQDIIRPFGISIENLRSQISFDEDDKEFALQFVKENTDAGKLLIGVHVGAGKIPNRWSVDNFAEIINFLREKYNAEIIFTGSDADKETLEELFAKLKNTFPEYLNHSIPKLAALIDETDLFITNDTGVLHVAAATRVPQISIFGPTDPQNWGAVGEEKINLRNEDDINSVTVNDVIESIQKLLG